ncbi:unnamed protein product [Linum tenue]|uniref:Uncharacterized protein n=1 Tax=Linum tenue TaxID=586396 RepID=A0AAV0H801_9ROSI|nr:unnamed protein product [Linum tenue]
MAPPFIFLAILFTTLHSLCISAQPDNPQGTRITIMGSVYCDACSTSTFSKHSYFLPDAEVHVQCILRASSPRTEEQIHFSVNRTTNKYGVYKLEIPNVEGIDCVDDGSAIQSMCQASLIKSSASSCSLPGLRTTTDQISVKSRQQNLCIYSFSALSYKPTKINQTLCSNLEEESLPSPFNSSKFFFPFFPPYKFPFPFPPLPQIPPLPPFPFPPLPFQPQPPSLPFPFPPLPPLPQLPPLPSFPFPPFPPVPSLFQPPPPPAFNLGDPRTWVPSFPPFSPTPASFPPPPPAFSLGDPRTWIPSFPPSPPTAPP